MSKDKNKEIHGRDAKRRKGATKRRKPSKSKDDYVENGELTVIEGWKKGRKRRSIIRAMFRLLIAAVLAVGGIALWQNWDSIAPDSFVVWFNEKMAGGQTGNGYPVQMTGSSVISMESNRDGLVVLTDSAVVMFNHKGGELFRRQHGYSKPLLKTAGKWVLLLESDGKRYRLETRGETFINGETTSKILSGTVDGNGNYILVTESAKDFFCEVRLYNSKGEVKYEWLSSKLIVSDVALSEDGKYFAASGFNAENGTMVSKILAFDIKGKEPVEVYSESGSMIFSLSFFEGGNIFSLSDTAAVTVNISATIKERFSFSGQEVVGSSVGKIRAAIVLKDSASASGGTVAAFTETGDTAFTASFSGEFRDVCCHSDETYILTSKKAILFGESGSEKAVDVDTDNRLICRFGSKVMMVGLGEIDEVEFK